MNHLPSRSRGDEHRRVRTRLRRAPLIGVAVLAVAVLAVAVVAGGIGPLRSNGVVPAAAQEGEPANVDDDFRPAPPSIGADIPLSYFGPSPSSVDPRLVGPVQLLTAGRVDQEALTVELPLYQGRTQNQHTVWYVLTDTTDERNAAALGLNVSSKLNYADVGSAVRTARLETDGTLTFLTSDSLVDFSPELAVTPGEEPNPFPPTSVQPGSVGERNYTPLVRVRNAGGHVYNAPIVAGDFSAEEIAACGPDDTPDHSRVHDKVVHICPGTDGEPGTVTLSLTPGFSFGKPILYLSFDSNQDLAAALEMSTLAPALSSVRVGGDDGAFSAVERIFGVTNGPRNVVDGEQNPQRQGFASALAGEGPGPLNVLGGIPTVATDYSPLWDLNLSEWTPHAVENGYVSRLIDEFQILGFAQRGFLTGPGGAPFGSSGIIINCPIVARLG
jgi:hypothetical protein